MGIWGRWPIVRGHLMPVLSETEDDPHCQQTCSHLELDSKQHSK